MRVFGKACSTSDLETRKTPAIAIHDRIRFARRSIQSYLELSPFVIHLERLASKPFLKRSIVMTATSTEIEELLKRPGAPLAAIVATIIWVALVILVSVLKRVWTLEGNAIGDFVAGAFAPVAFGWLILGYLRQGQELKLQAAELALMRSEVANQTEVFKATLAQERIALNASLLQQISNSVPIWMVEVLERFKPFTRVPNAAGQEVHFDIWDEPISPENLEELRKRSRETATATVDFKSKHGSSLRAAMQAKNPEAFKVLESFAKLLVRRDQSFLNSPEDLERGMWEDIRRKYGLHHLVAALQEMLEEEQPTDQETH